MQGEIARNTIENPIIDYLEIDRSNLISLKRIQATKFPIQRYTQRAKYKNIISGILKLESQTKIRISLRFEP